MRPVPPLSLRFRVPPFPAGVVPGLRLRRLRLGGVWLFAWLALMARADDDDYRATLRALCDVLVATQIQDPGSPDHGALVCPSTNPQEHPLHSRAAEAVYPLAVAYQETHETKYRAAAIHLADWLLRKQQPTGAWGEDWPKYDGWAGTTSDQLLSLAGAWPLLQADLTATQRTAWRAGITAAAEYVVRTFPVGTINYQPTGAVALVLASRVVEPSPRWRPKAEALIAQTLAGVNADGLLVGEGKGVDLGYNIAQSIGYLALYALLTRDEPLRRTSAELLRTHATFVYPNGTIDNSWGTRSFKWTYESGTKTAPGVYFAFALLADQDPSFAAEADRCLRYLRERALTKDGFVGRPPHPAVEPRQLIPPPGQPTRTPPSTGKSEPVT